MKRVASEPKEQSQQNQKKKKKKKQQQPKRAPPKQSRKHIFTTPEWIAVDWDLLSIPFHALIAYGVCDSVLSEEAVTRTAETSTADHSAE